MDYGGLVKLGETYQGSLLVVNTSDTPLNADALPNFRVYGPDGFVKEGTTSFRDTGTITNATNATPISITSSAHGLTTGAYITISGVVGNTAANGTFYVTRVDNNTYTLDTSVGNSSYTSGGTWNEAGLYGFSISVAAVDGYEAGEAYQIQFSYDISTVATSQLQSFQVN